jgi:hypothetical protein
MPDSAVPFIIAIVAAFSVFIGVVGGVSIWTYIPVRNDSGPKSPDDRR